MNFLYMLQFLHLHIFAFIFRSRIKEYTVFISRCHVVPRCNKCNIAPFTYIFPPLGMHPVGFMLSCIFNVSDYNTM